MHERAAEFARRASEEHGLEVEVTEFPEGTKTAKEAASAIGCSVEQIASSLVFDAGGELVVVVTSGANRVSESALAAYLGVDSVAMADAETVRETVGWSIGGVPPLCHDTALRTLFDPTLAAHDTVWAAAGTPTTVFPVDPDRLRDLAGAELADVLE